VKSAHLQMAGILALIFVAGAPAQSTLQFDAEAEQQVLSALNQSRAEAGVPALKLDDKLQDAARTHTRLLVQHGALSHQFPGEPPLNQRLRTAGVFFTAAAENAGRNSEADDVNSMFLRSPGHRQNMLNADYNAVGIGVVHRGGDYWVTEDFAALSPALSAQQAEDEAAAAFEAEWKKTGAALPKRLSIEAVRTFACTTGRSGGKVRKEGITYEGKSSRELAGYSTPDPSALAPQVESVISNRNVGFYAVGACTPQQSGDNGQFWIVMVFF